MIISLTLLFYLFIFVVRNNYVRAIHKYWNKEIDYYRATSVNQSVRNLTDIDFLLDVMNPFKWGKNNFVSKKWMSLMELNKYIIKNNVENKRIELSVKKRVHRSMLNRKDSLAELRKYCIKSNLKEREDECRDD